MTTSWTTIPHVTQHDRADVTSLEAFRRGASARVEAHGAKLTVTAILLKLCATALKTYPQFNASYDAQAEELIYKRYYNIGVAVDTERGLIVPVVRNADLKSLTQLAVELGDLAQRTRDKKIKPDELEGGNFTISNLGGIGGTAFTPIVYAPQVAILGVARTQREATLAGGTWEERLYLPLSLSYDHRVIDGADGARFLRWLVEALEDPYLAVLEG
jgi:pyruvate dehydrogenase E2 component (dihydrolipoamide acetyltransferase)